MAILLTGGQRNLKDSISQILDTFKTDIDSTRGIFIKPNIVFPVKPKSGEITSPELVKTLIWALRERYENIDIVLGEGVAAGCIPEENFRVSGYSDLARELNIPLLDLHSAEYKTVEWKYGKLKLPRIAFERTYINLPILKSSSACTISGALKNQKGLLQPSMKKRFHHMGLHEQVAELNVIVKPALTILDGSQFFGQNVLISGNNCGEIDSISCRLLGIDEPAHVQLARRALVFTSEYTVQGDEENIKLITPRPVDKEYKHIGRLRLWSNSQACTMCRNLFIDLRRNMLNPENLIAGAKLLPYSIKGAEILMGSNPKWRREYNTVICIGSCTRRTAEEGDIYIPGCPPSVSDLSENLPWFGKANKDGDEKAHSHSE